MKSLRGWIFDELEEKSTTTEKPISYHLPRILGVLLIFASLGYLVDSFANVLLPKVEAIITITSSILIGIAVVAELSLSL